MIIDAYRSVVHNVPMLKAALHTVLSDYNHQRRSILFFSSRPTKFTALAINIVSNQEKIELWISDSCMDLAHRSLPTTINQICTSYAKSVAQKQSRTLANTAGRNLTASSIMENQCGQMRHYGWFGEADEVQLNFDLTPQLNYIGKTGKLLFSISFFTAQSQAIPIHSLCTIIN